jgi:hypothetical protein
MRFRACAMNVLQRKHQRILVTFLGLLYVSKSVVSMLFVVRCSVVVVQCSVDCSNHVRSSQRGCQDVPTFSSRTVPLTLYPLPWLFISLADSMYSTVQTLCIVESHGLYQICRCFDLAHVDSILSRVCKGLKSSV